MPKTFEQMMFCSNFYLPSSGRLAYNCQRKSHIIAASLLDSFHCKTLSEFQNEQGGYNNNADSQKVSFFKIPNSGLVCGF